LRKISNHFLFCWRRPRP